MMEARERREVVGNRGGERPRWRRPRPSRQGSRSGHKLRKKEREVGNEEPVSRQERERTLVVGDCIGDENGKKKEEAGGWAVLVERTGREGRQGGGIDDEGRRGRSRAAAEEIGRGGRKEKRWSAVDSAMAAVLTMEKEAVANREWWRSRSWRGGAQSQRGAAMHR